MNSGSLSVVITNYNHAHYIGGALEAVLSQSYKPMEVIIVDDASTDNSVEVIQQFVKRDSIVRLIRNEKNMGALHNDNRLLQLAQGDYIYMTASDDQVLPGFFEKSMKLITKYPQAGICCSDPASLDGRTGVIKENRLHWSKNPRYFSPSELAKVIRGGYIAAHTSLIKRSALLELGCWVPELTWHADWFMLLVVGFRHGICYIPELLATIRVLPDSYSASGRRNWTLQRRNLKLLLNLLKSPVYRDVLPYFVRGNSMCHFGSEIVRVVVSSPRHWDFQSFMLIRNPLWNEFRRILSFITPASVKRIYRRLREGGIRFRAVPVLRDKSAYGAKSETR